MSSSDVVSRQKARFACSVSVSVVGRVFSPQM